MKLLSEDRDVVMSHSGVWMLWIVLLVVRRPWGVAGKEMTRKNVETAKPVDQLRKLPSGVDISEAVVNGWMRYVEVWIVIDNKLLKQFGNDRKALKQRCIDIINIVNKITSSLLIKVTLSGIHFLSYMPKLDTNDHHRLLENFSPERQALLEQGKEHDHTVLLSGQNFAGSTAGYAYVGEMCSLKSTSVVQHSRKSVSKDSVAKILAHEMGHSLGANHDQANCVAGNNKGSTLMTGQNVGSEAWSNCSKIDIAEIIDLFTCLENEPRVPKQFSSCGNGVVEEGEQCDCGLPEACLNQCCDPNTCQLKPGALCANGRCCNLKTCRPYQSGTVCRKSRTECDLPEYCSGTTENCPSDIFKYNGEACFNGTAMCFEGVCGSPDLLCMKYISPSAKHAKKNDSSVPRWMMVDPCKNLLCLTYLHLVSKESLKITAKKTSYSYWDKVPALQFEINSTGLTCGDNKICIENKCTSLPTRSMDVCPSGCSHNGVCNSAGRCHCDFTFSPPDCLYPGYGGSLDSGPSTHSQNEVNFWIYVLFLGIIPTFVLIYTLFVNIRIIYERKWRETCSSRYPVCCQCLDNCCCPCMLFIFPWQCGRVSKPTHLDFKKKTTSRNCRAHVFEQEKKGSSDALKVLNPKRSIPPSANQETTYRDHIPHEPEKDRKVPSDLIKILNSKYSPSSTVKQETTPSDPRPHVLGHSKKRPTDIIKIRNPKYPTPSNNKQETIPIDHRPHEIEQEGKKPSDMIKILNSKYSTKHS